MKPFRYSGEKFALRPVRMGDAKSLNTIANEPGVNEFILLQKPVSLASTKSRISQKNPRLLWVAVLEKGNVVGSIEVKPFYGRKAHVVDFGIAFSRKAHGRGVAFGAMRAVFHELKRQGFRVVCSHVFSDNPRARRFYQKLGFRELSRLPGTIRRGKRFIGEIVICKRLT